MKKILIIVFIVILILSGIIVATINTKINDIKEYENILIKKYSDTSILNNPNDRDNMLDEMEVYIKNNQRRLLIKNYYRINDSITIVFVFGSRYMIWPEVNNMK